MKIMKIIIFIIIIFIILYLLYLLYLLNNKTTTSNKTTNTNKSVIIDNFGALNITDKIMTFDYLTNKNYTKNILDIYYNNDDTILNNRRVNIHPFQFRQNNFYGNPRFLTLDKRLSDSYYNQYNIRV